MSKWRKAAYAAFVLAWFVYFNRDVLGVKFAPDDMMNLAYYFRAGTLRLLASQLTPWTGFYRPIGGLVYMGLFGLFGLNPIPYHATILVLLAASVALVYLFAKSLGCSEPVAGVAALAMAYHPGLSNLYYNSGFLYDVLCLFFYLAAWVWYTRGRSAAGFLVLFLCALNSKEMAVTLPVALAAWEWLYHRKRPRWPLAAAAAIDVAFVLGRFIGPEALATQSGYGPVFSLQRVVDFQKLMFSDVFLVWHYSVWPLWFAVLLVAALRGRMVLRFCWVFAVLIAPLPIEFLQGRGAACLAIPAAALSVFVAVTLADLADLLRRVGGRPAAAALLVAALYLWAHRVHYLKAWLIEPAMAALGQSGWHVIEAFRTANPHVRSNSLVVILNDPSTDLETASIAQLWFRDRTVNIRLQRQNPMTPEELARVDYRFEFRDGRLVQVK